MSIHERPTWAQDLPDIEYELAMRGWFTVGAAAAYLHVSRSWIYMLSQTKRVSSRKVGKRHIFRKDDIDKLLPSG